MRKNKLASIGLLIVIAMITSCAKAIIAPPGLSSKITNITINDTDSATIITIKTNFLPQYAAFKTESPFSITLDLASTNASGVSKNLSVNNGFVKKIYIHQLGASTGYSSRIVITLNKPLSYKVTNNGNNIVLNISKSGQLTSAVPELIPPLGGLQQTPAVSLKAGAEITALAAPEAFAPIGMAMSPTAQLTPAAPSEQALMPLTAGAEITAPAVPEAFAPIGMEASPTAQLTPAAPSEQALSAGAKISPSSLPSSSIEEQPMTAENMQSQATNVTSSVSAPVAVSQVSPVIKKQVKPLIVSQTPVAKQHKKEERVAMLVPTPSVSATAERVRIKNNIIITSVPLIFKNNEAVLSESAGASLKIVADYMLKHKNIKLIIEGYSDANGPESYNKELSFYRTIWVKLALERYGISSSRLIAKPLGKTSRFGHTKSTSAQNRRVVLRIAK